MNNTVSKAFLTDISRHELSVAFRACAPNLRTLVTAYNFYGLFGQGYDAGELYMPATVGIRFNWSVVPWTGRYGNGPAQDFGDAIILGPSVRNMTLNIPPDGISIGIGLSPLGLQRILGVRADHLTGRVVPLGTLWPDASDIYAQLSHVQSIDAAAQFFDQLLADRLGPQQPEQATIAALMDLLPQHHDLSVTTIAERLHVSESTLRRVSLRHFGFPIKVLLRRSRFMKSLVSIYGQEPGNWAKLIDPSYHDQSHFIKDFRYFMGISPTEFFSRPSPMTQLSMRARKDLLGAAVAALHKTRE